MSLICGIWPDFEQLAWEAMVTLQNKTAIIFTYTLANPPQRWNYANLYLNLRKNVGLFLKENYIFFVWSPAFPKALAQWFSALAAHRIICGSFQTHSWVGPRHQYICPPLLRWLPTQPKFRTPAMSPTRALAADLRRQGGVCSSWWELGSYRVIIHIHPGLFSSGAKMCTYAASGSASSSEPSPVSL